MTSAFLQIHMKPAFSLTQSMNKIITFHTQRVHGEAVFFTVSKIVSPCCQARLKIDDSWDGILTRWTTSAYLWVTMSSLWAFVQRAMHSADINKAVCTQKCTIESKGLNLIRVASFPGFSGMWTCVCGESLVSLLTQQWCNQNRTRLFRTERPYCSTNHVFNAWCLWYSHPDNKRCVVSYPLHSLFFLFWVFGYAHAQWWSL